MDLFKEATYDQLQRVLKVIDRTKPVSHSRPGIPSLDFLEHWIADTLKPRDHAFDLSTELTIKMWEEAIIKGEQE